jgi:hypothetical protein
MDQAYLEKFCEKIALHRELWKSVRVICFAVRQVDVWLNLAARVLLRELPPEPPRILAPLDDFISSAVDFPMLRLDQILNDILIEGFVPIKLESSHLKAHLTRARAGLPPGSSPSNSWFGPTSYQRLAALREYEITRPCIAIATYGERTAEVLSPDILEKLNSKLRLCDSPYDGIDDLARKWLPGSKLTDPNSTPTQIVAPVPFDFRYGEPGRVIVRAPIAAGDGRLGFRAFFRPQGVGPLQVVRPQDASAPADLGIFGWESPVDWPSESIGAKIVLFFREQEVDSIEVNRWPDSADLRVAVDTFFDPKHERLRELLVGEKSKDSVLFELAIVRLLNLLGVPMVWYGKGSADARPDIGGLHVDEKNRVIFVGECTRERPAEKFSGLAERARELRASYAGEAEVLAVVFTRAATTATETQQASEYGISLVGRAELEALLRLLGTPVKSSEVVHFLRTVRPPYFPGLSPGFDPERWKGR